MLLSYLFTNNLSRPLSKEIKHFIAKERLKITRTMLHLPL